MTVNDRVREVRKALGYTQTEFGEKTSIGQGYLTNIETGRREVSDKIVKLICATFNVDYLWLTTGIGTMFHQSSNPVADRIDDLLYGENETAKAVFRAFAYFSDEDWNLVQKFIDHLPSQGNKKDGPN
jgi:Predicted transcriptional regulators